MRVRSATFSITRTIPLAPITGDPADEYANIKPFASCTVEFDDDECDFTKVDRDAIKAIVKAGYDEATSRAFEQMQDFKRELLDLYKTSQQSRRRRTTSTE